MPFHYAHRLKRWVEKQRDFLRCHGYFYTISSQSIEKGWDEDDPEWAIIKLELTPNAEGLKRKLEPQKITLTGAPGRWVNEDDPQLLIPNHLVSLLNHLHRQPVAPALELQPLPN